MRDPQHIRDGKGSLKPSTSCLFAFYILDAVAIRTVRMVMFDYPVKTFSKIRQSSEVCRNSILAPLSSRLTGKQSSCIWISKMLRKSLPRRSRPIALMVNVRRESSAGIKKATLEWDPNGNERTPGNWADRCPSAGLAPFPFPVREYQYRRLK